MFRYALALPVAGLIAALAAPVTAQGQVFWNTLDSETAVENSMIGPDLRLFVDRLVERSFVNGVDGFGVTAESLSAELHCSTHNLFLDDPAEVLNSERGAIQLWARFDKLPQDVCEDTIRLFGGPYDQIPSGIGIWIENQYGEPRLQFELGADIFGAVTVYSPDDGRPGAPLNDYLHRWIKVNALWDRSGIDGLDNPYLPTFGEYKMALFIDGRFVAGTMEIAWFGGFGPQVGIAGFTGIDLDNSFVMDQLEIWDSAVPPRPEPAFFNAYPGCSGSAGVPVLAAKNHDRPWLQSQFTMTVDTLPIDRTCVCIGLLGFDRDNLNGTPLPLDLGIIGAPGCALYVDPFFDQLLGNNLGQVEWSITIPNLPSLIGLKFFTQTMVLDPAANPLGAAFSNACEARIGV